ncbi:hypothetical protein [Photobacterium toruni]|uniref:Uncharacterized protein n=1 Tax=Photobacterium toruni TaxID=1935446 RepID=A0A1T4UHC4_9GAMM|nr:hypothetical protein [Photobacterium toruni]SKA51871.1 hypothetical protein CZ814_03231 [Photobacterium toruni]
MSLAHYTQLQQRNGQKVKQSPSESLGMVLPELTQGNLSIKRDEMDIHAVCEAITQFVPQSGWVCYRDAVVIENHAPTRTDVVEAEYFNGECTLVIKLLSGHNYQVLTLSNDTGDNVTKVYREQHFLLRGDQKSQAQQAVYRLWFEQENTGRWLPLVQQFIGFAGEGEQ